MLHIHFPRYIKNECCLILAALVLASCSQSLPFQPQILLYDGNKVTDILTPGATPSPDSARLCRLPGTEGDGVPQWEVKTEKSRVAGDATATDYMLTFSIQEGEIASGGAAVEFTFDDWHTDNYIFAPSHLYNGNRFRIYPVGYPPMIRKAEDRPLDMPITTTNIPHFSNEGKDACVDFRTNSCSTPLTGFFDRTAKRGFFLLTEQDTLSGSQAFFISEYPEQGRLTIRLSSPGVRQHRYVSCNADKQSEDEGIVLKAGDEITMHFRVYDFTCEDLSMFFDKFLTVRKSLSGENEYRNLEPFSSIDSTIMAHHFATKWFENEEFGYECHGPAVKKTDPYALYYHMQLGWNGIPVYTLMQLARPEYQSDYNEVLRRVARSFESICYCQRESGLLNAFMTAGDFYGDTYNYNLPEEQDVVLVTRLGLALYYGLQCMDMLKLQGRGDMIEARWEECFRKEADALVALFRRYGEFGQLVHACTGEMYTPNSTAGASCIGALAYASKYYGNPEYLKIAEEAAEYYYQEQLSKGYSGGGPAEILQAPDSESAAQLTESYTALYELTGEDKWLKYARDAAALFSTWVVSYDYHFPEESCFGKAGVKATGSVWANVQNEHSAPGIYVMSGDFLLKLFRSTGDMRYLELCKDMAHNVVQYVNTEGNRVQPGNGNGYCTERVNLGDWEGEGAIGNVGHDSNCAWENVAMYHTTENPGIYVQPDRDLMMVFDHVSARITGHDEESVTLEITNPTYRDGNISILAETSSFAREHPLGWLAFSTWPTVHVASGQTLTVTVPMQKENP